MKKRAYQLLAAGIVSIASMFVLMGSYTFIHKPEIPAELRKKGA